MKNKCRYIPKRELALICFELGDNSKTYEELMSMSRKKLFLHTVIIGIIKSWTPIWLRAFEVEAQGGIVHSGPVLPNTGEMILDLVSKAELVNIITK